MAIGNVELMNEHLISQSILDQITAKVVGLNLCFTNLYMTNTRFMFGLPICPKNAPMIHYSQACIVKAFFSAKR